MNDSERGSSARRKRAQQDFEEEALDQEGSEKEALSSLPAHGLPYGIIAGIVAGVLGVLLNLALTFLNAPLYQQAAKAGNDIAYNTALAVVGIQCLNFLLSVFVCFLAGYFVGKMAVQRRLGFYAGSVAGVIMYVISLLVHFIPGYPGNTPANSPTET